MSVADTERAAQEMVYCEKVLAKSGSSVLLKTLPKDGFLTWKHYPEQDVYDPASGAQWYYHCHDDSEASGEHGHFHCFVRPNGRESQPCHLVAIGVDAHGRLVRLFTVNQWVVGGSFNDAKVTNSLLDQFNMEMAEPDFLVNRWLTAVVSRFEDRIRSLNLERDAKLHALREKSPAILEDRSIEILSEWRINT